MKKWLLCVCIAASLSACASSGSGSSQMYGEIKGGIGYQR